MHLLQAAGHAGGLLPAYLLAHGESGDENDASDQPNDDEEGAGEAEGDEDETASHGEGDDDSLSAAHSTETEQIELRKYYNEILQRLQEVEAANEAIRVEKAKLERLREAHYGKLWSASITIEKSRFSVGILQLPNHISHHKSRPKCLHPYYAFHQEVGIR